MSSSCIPECVPLCVWIHGDSHEERSSVVCSVQHDDDDDDEAWSAARTDQLNFCLLLSTDVERRGENRHIVFGSRDGLDSFMWSRDPIESVYACSFCSLCGVCVCKEWQRQKVCNTVGCFCQCVWATRVLLCILLELVKWDMALWLYAHVLVLDYKCYMNTSKRVSPRFSYFPAKNAIP